MLEDRLLRAGTALTDLWVDIPNGVSGIVVLERYMRQLRFLKIRLFSGWSTAADAAHEICSLLTRGYAPSLEALSICLAGSSTISQPLFGHHTPKLRFVDFYGLEYKCPSARHPTVTRFCTGFPNLRLPSQLNDVLRPFSMLDVLDVWTPCYLPDITRDFRPSSQPISIPPRLDALILRCDSESPISEDVLRLIPHHSVRQVKYVAAGEVDYHDIPPPFPTDAELNLIQDRVRPFHMAFHTIYDEGHRCAIYDSVFFDIVIVDSVGFKRTFNAPHSSLCPQFMKTLGSLHINETDLHHWLLTITDKHAPPLQLDALAHLAVFLYESKDYAADNSWRSPFFAALSHGPIIAAPSLRTLTLTAREHTTIAPGTVCDFISAYLGRSDDPPLHCLSLMRVRILEHPLLEVARLTAMVHNIDYDDRCLDWDEDVSCLTKEPDVDFS